MGAHALEEGGLSPSAPAARLLAQHCCVVETSPLARRAKADRGAATVGQRGEPAAPPVWWQQWPEPSHSLEPQGRPAESQGSGVRGHLTSSPLVFLVFHFPSFRVLMLSLLLIISFGERRVSGAD